MSPTTRSAQAARTHSDRLAEAFTDLAAVIYSGQIPTDGHLHSVRITILAESPAVVEQVAARLHVDVEVHTAEDGSVHTSCELGFGDGQRPESTFPSSRFAAVVWFAHIQDAPPEPSAVAQAALLAGLA